MILKYFLLLIFISSLYSCVEEPTIEPTPLPYTTVRLGNFSNNVDAIQVTIDGEKSFTINKGDLTDYFDLVSGKRKFVVTNTANSVQIFSADLDATAYEELNILFTGYSAPGDDINNSFGNYNFTEGLVYLFEGPTEPNKVWVRFFNFISDTPDETSVEIQVSSYDITGDSSNTATAFAFNEYKGLAVDQGQKNILTLNSDATDTLSVLTGQNMNSGLDYFVFITGSADNPAYFVNQREPLEVRSK